MSEAEVKSSIEIIKSRLDMSEREILEFWEDEEDGTIKEACKCAMEIFASSPGTDVPWYRRLFPVWLYGHKKASLVKLMAATCIILPHVVAGIANEVAKQKGLNN